MAGRVAFVLKGYPRLSETFIAQEIHGLERLGLDIEIVSLRHPTDGARHPIHDEIAASVRHSRAGLLRFLDRFPQFEGRAYLVSPDALPLRPGSAAGRIGSLPLDLLLLAASRQADRALAQRLGG